MPLETMPRRARCLSVVALLAVVGFPPAELFGMSAMAGEGHERFHAKPPRVLHKSRRQLTFLSFYVAASRETAVVVSSPSRPILPTQDDSLAVFVRTHLALQALRDRMQAEMAAPRNKKDEEQQALREKLRTERARILKEHAMTEAQFARMTRWVSVNDSARKVFDALVAKAGSRGS
jgi:hypothetical protein